MSKRKTIRISDILTRINLYISICKVDGVLNFEAAERRLIKLDMECIAKAELAYLDTIRNMLYFCDILTEAQSYALIDAHYDSSRTPIQRYVNVLRLFNEYLGEDA